MKVTACGVVHEWWHSKPNEMNKFEVVADSFVRATFHSFGSVCLGSLFIGPANFLRQLADYIRPNKEEAAIQSLVVMQEWIVSAIDYFCDKFCNFNFAYVGMLFDVYHVAYQYHYSVIQNSLTDFMQSLHQSHVWL